MLASLTGCALFKEQGPKLTAEEKTIKTEIISDWNVRSQTVLMKDHSFGYDPGSFKGSICHGTGLFQKYELDSISEDDYSMGTLAYFCPPENRYWINQHAGGAFYFNRWAGPFPYKAAEDVSVDSQE